MCLKCEAPKTKCHSQKSLGIAFSKVRMEWTSSSHNLNILGSQMEKLGELVIQNTFQCMC